MIKTFNDYKNSKFLDNERESMERELRTRKVQRDNMKQDLNINLDLIIREIMYSISNDEDYVLTIGKKKEELEGTSDTVFHIEFENEKFGRVRIFKPKDTADKGHYEVNGDYYETTAQKIRELYHTLNQEIKGNEMIVRTAVTESIISKMTPKTFDEMNDAYQKRLDELAILAIEDFPRDFDDYIDTFNHLDNNYSDKIKEKIEDGDDNQTILNDIMFGWDQ